MQQNNNNKVVSAGKRVLGRHPTPSSGQKFIKSTAADNKKSRPATTMTNPPSYAMPTVSSMARTQSIVPAPSRRPAAAKSKAQPVTPSAPRVEARAIKAQPPRSNTHSRIPVASAAPTLPPATAAPSLSLATSAPTPRSFIPRPMSTKPEAASLSLQTSTTSFDPSDPDYDAEWEKEKELQEQAKLAWEQAKALRFAARRQKTPKQPPKSVRWADEECGGDLESVRVFKRPSYQAYDMFRRTVWPEECK